MILVTELERKRSIIQMSSMVEDRVAGLYFVSIPIPESPLQAAKCNGVRPLLSAYLGSAPHINSSCMSSYVPLLDNSLCSFRVAV